MLLVRGSDFEWSVSNQSTPAQDPGTSIAPAQNSMGTPVQLLSALAEEVWWVEVCISSNFGAGAAARDTLVDIMADPAGGSSYSVIIPYLLGGNAGNLLFGGIWYAFPLYIPAGATVAAQASVNNATVGTARVWITCYGKPSRPENCRRGSYVRSFGQVTASSRGTSITPGASGAEGSSWVQLGSNTADPELWWWQTGIGVNDSTMAARVLFLDVGAGDGSNKELIIENEYVITDGTERINKPLRSPSRYYHSIPSGVGIYGRASNSGTNDAAYSMMAWGVGG